MSGGHEARHGGNWGPIPKKGFKLKEAAVYLGVQPTSVRRLISRGILKPLRVLRHIIIPVSQLDALLEGESEGTCA